MTPDEMDEFEQWQAEQDQIDGAEAAAAAQQGEAARFVQICREDHVISLVQQQQQPSGRLPSVPFWSGGRCCTSGLAAAPPRLLPKAIWSAS
jgi:hypothetical protein